jgi:hypothetical protein
MPNTADAEEYSSDHQDYTRNSHGRSDSGLDWKLVLVIRGSGIVVTSVSWLRYGRGVCRRRTR